MGGAMTEPHTKWIDLLDEEQVSWGISYLLRKYIYQADMNVLRLLKNGGDEVDVREHFGDIGNLRFVRRQMENAWRVRCSRRRSSPRKVKYVTISVTSKSILKEQAAEQNVTESSILNEMLRDFDGFKKRVEKKLENDAEHFKAQLHRKRMKDKDIRINKQVTVLRHIAGQTVIIEHLQEVLDRFLDEWSRFAVISEENKSPLAINDVESQKLASKLKGIKANSIIPYLAELQQSNATILKVLES